MEYGKRLQAARLKRGYTQQELAKKAGVAYQTISNMETGRYQAQLGTALDIAAILDVSLDWLMSRTKDPYSHKRAAERERV